MNYKTAGFALLLISLSLSTVGCDATTSRNTSSNLTSAGAKSDSVSKPVDGRIISFTPITVQNMNGSLQAYQMFYWSEHIKTEAFVAIPKAAGPYPLFVNCHGGSSTALNMGHYNSPMGGQNLADSNPKFITLIPEYRGYAGSDGTIPGLSGATLDTNNAIKAVMGKFSVEHNHIDLAGTSFGGGVVLNLASQRGDIHSVIAISPFVGWDIVGAWAVKNKTNNTLAAKKYKVMTYYYGSFNPNSSKYKNESINYKNIHAPTLLLQGKGDTSVPWQTVQSLYNDMKTTNHHVKLDLIPWGTHGLHGQFQQETNNYIMQWNKKYG